jgi:hypothetical protein
LPSTLTNGSRPTSADAPAGFSRAAGLVVGWPRQKWTPGARDDADVTNREAAICWGGAVSALPWLGVGFIGEKAMRSILALSLSITLCGAANAAMVHHAHPRHAIARSNQGTIASDPASGFAYVPSGPPIQYRPAPYNYYNGPYPGDSQGYAPGEREEFLDSVRQGG